MRYTSPSAVKYAGVKMGPNAKGTPWIKIDLNTKVNNHLFTFIFGVLGRAPMCGDKITLAIDPTPVDTSVRTKVPGIGALGVIGVIATVYRVPKRPGEYFSAKFLCPRPLHMPETAQVYRVRIQAIDSFNHGQKSEVVQSGINVAAELDAIQASLTKIRGLLPK